MLRDYSVRGFLLGAIATALYVTDYTWGAALWAFFSVLYLGLATIWETVERRARNRTNHPAPPTPAPKKPPHRTPRQAPDLPPHAAPPRTHDDEDDDGP